MGLTDRAGRWATEQVGRHGRSVSEVADDLACDWHTVNDAVIAYGTALVDDPNRIGEPDSVGLDETLYVRHGEYRRQCWSTQIVDVPHGRLLDIVAGRDSVEPCVWFAARPDVWRARIRWATLDLSSSYKMVFDTMLSDATPVADPFHVVRLANQALDDCRRRVAERDPRPPWPQDRPAVSLSTAPGDGRERLSVDGHEKLLGLLAAGDPRREVWFAWNAKEVVRQIYVHTDHQLAIDWVDEIVRDFADDQMPPEVRRLGRTIRRWRDPIVAWHRSHVSNGPTEPANNLVKRVKRVAFGFRRFQHYRIRALLYAGAPNWTLLTTITPPLKSEAPDESLSEAFNRTAIPPAVGSKALNAADERPVESKSVVTPW